MSANGWPLSIRMEYLSSETCEFETVDTKRNKPDRFVFGRRGGNALAGGRSPVLHARRRCDSPSDVTLDGKTWPLVERKEKKGTRQWGLFRELSGSGGMPMLECAFSGSWRMCDYGKGGRVEAFKLRVGKRVKF
jgi:hypothetical protein